jgi:hypothetical protein
MKKAPGGAFLPSGQSMPPAWQTPAVVFALVFFVDGLGSVIGFYGLALSSALLGGLFGSGSVVAVVYIGASEGSASQQSSEQGSGNDGFHGEFLKG